MTFNTGSTLLCYIFLSLRLINMNCIRYFFLIWFNPTFYFDYNRHYYEVSPDMEKQTSCVRIRKMFMWLKTNIFITTTIHCWISAVTKIIYQTIITSTYTLIWSPNSCIVRILEWAGGKANNSYNINIVNIKQIKKINIMAIFQQLCTDYM